MNAFGGMTFPDHATDLGLDGEVSANWRDIAALRVAPLPVQTCPHPAALVGSM
ncbi:MAG: hypothetical protein M3Y57_18855 [Acidobacteriota bacterium]|nr:hypothetical protein [Acidobacteriota bacterium]